MRNIDAILRGVSGRLGAFGRWARARWSDFRPVERWLVAAGAAGLCLALVFSGVVLWYAHDLPDIEQLKSPERQPSVTITATDGSLIATYGDLFAGPVRLEDLPPMLVFAILATEDRNFFDHIGFDPFAMLRAAFVNLKSGAVRQGGSTITQQLAKNLFLSSERTLRRKVQELILAFWLELKFTKREIFSIYVNRLYLGAGTHGVAAAAKRYFGVSPADLSLHEIAVLAGLIKAPSRYAPSHNPDGARRRARVVLGGMVAEGYLTPEAADAAARQPLRLVKESDPGGARYFTDWILGRAQRYLGRMKTDLVIRTTLDPLYQKAAVDGLVPALARAGMRKGGPEGALVAMSPNGAVRAMVGGADYRNSQFNRATQAARQPGSAFKLFVYLAGLEAGMSPGDTVVDEPVAVGDWAPQNYGGKYHGRISLREAFARSLNSVAVRVSETVGRERVIEAAERLGIASPLTPHPSLALGTSEVTLLELTAAYAVIVNGGNKVVPHGIEEIRYRDGTVLFSYRSFGDLRLIDADHADELREMMEAVVSVGTGRRAATGRAVAGKTGTSQDFRDAWFVGFTPDLVAGVWMGNDDGSPMDRVVGGTLPALIWRDFVSAVPDGSSATFARHGRWSFFSRLGSAFRGLFDRSPAGSPDRNEDDTGAGDRPPTGRR